MNTKSYPALAERPDGSAWPLADAAKYAAVSLRTLTRLIAAGRVRSIKIGHRRLIPDAEVKRLAAEGC